MGDISDLHREMYYAREWDEDPDEPTNDEYFLANLIKKYSDNRNYSISTLVSLVKSRIETGIIKHPTVLGILSSFDKNKCLSGKQRDVLITALAYSDQKIHC